MKTIIAGIVARSAAALLAATAGGAAASAQTKVGLLLPTSGVYAALGTEIEAGFTIALDQAGMADRFTLYREDTEVKPPVGLSKARKLVLQDRVDVIVGIVSSGVLGAVRDFVHNSKVPLIVANAGNDKATGAACSPYIVRVSFSNSQVNRPLGRWMAENGVKTAYTLAPDYAAGRQMIDAFTGSFTAAGGRVVGGAFTPFRKTKDFAPYLTKAKAANPDALFVFYAGGEAIGFVKQYDAFGLKADVPLYGPGFVTSPLYVDKQGAAAVGVVTSLHYIPTLDTPANTAFVAAFSAKAGRLPSEYAVQGYDAAQLLIEAVKSGASGRAGLAAALPTMRFTSPRGPFMIDPATNNVAQNIYIYKTVPGADGLTQDLLATVGNVTDPVAGCTM